MMEMYMIMIQKMTETGDMFYWMKNYGEYWRLVFNYPSVVALEIVILVMMIAMILFGIIMIRKLIKELKDDGVTLYDVKKVFIK